MSNKYLQIRMQALAINQCIQSHLQGRKFELDQLNRTYNQVSASERRLQDHVQSQVVQHEPNVNNLVKCFNSLCDDLSDLIQRHHALRHAVAPAKLD
ncbi:hypothetical protein FA13DRAFT_1799042 [Coprinellus micaceus]|uniref:Uncharacterized protein n=1 Tax=Coprinellus micaceus TaxID=71717 RepID=A0A4Y7SKC7_COPMI|nr:hypothetical protein FA13DRAFT_1799042 [Coprinellus micaceus]